MYDLGSGIKLSGIWKQHTLLCSIYPVLDLAFILIHSKGWFGYSNRIDPVSYTHLTLPTT